MARIYIQGWASFEEWRDAGFPGALDAYGNRKPTPKPRVIPPQMYTKPERFCVECGVKVVHGPRCKSCASKGHVRVPHWVKAAPLKERYSAAQCAG